MLYEYDPKSLCKELEDEKYLKKKYGVAICKGMKLFLQLLETAENAYDIKTMPVLFMEHLKNNLIEFYSISLDKKKSKWRLMLQMLDENGNVVTPTNNEKEFLESVKKIRIRGLSDHYGEY